MLQSVVSLLLQNETILLHQPVLRKIRQILLQNGVNMLLNVPSIT